MPALVGPYWTKEHASRAKMTPLESSTTRFMTPKPPNPKPELKTDKAPKPLNPPNLDPSPTKATAPTPSAEPVRAASDGSPARGSVAQAVSPEAGGVQGLGGLGLLTWFE